MHSNAVKACSISFSSHSQSLWSFFMAWALDDLTQQQTLHYRNPGNKSACWAMRHAVTATSN
jgi:hypothetical protein